MTSISVYIVTERVKQQIDMDEGSSAQREPREGNKSVKNFILKRQKVFQSGERGWGGGGVRIKFTLFFHRALWYS